MREELANLVYPVISYALRLKEDLRRGERPSLETEQSALKGLLLSDLESRRIPDFGGAMDSLAVEMTRIGEVKKRSGDSFLGARYGLVCWLDEIFVLDSPWESQWNELKLEVSLYGTNDRAWKFWEQARRAEASAGNDSLEVYFLCVMLGFRGDLRENPNKLRNWVDAVQARLSKARTQEWPAPRELPPPAALPPLYGPDRLQRVLFANGVVLLVIIPLAVYLVVKYLGQ